MVFLLMCSAEFTVKSKEQHPEHIKCREHSCYHTDNIHGGAVHKGMRQNLVLREEPCKRRNTGYSQRTDKHGYKCNFQLSFQAAHVAHILLAAYRVDYRTSAKEQ